jgi:exodeoxyribonuclease-5
LPQLSNILISKFPYEPTEGQKKLFLLFDKFINKDEDINAVVINGYAGTGKTTVLSVLVQNLPSFNYKSILLAPTGRAAKVLSTYSSRKAFTIHKIIYRQVADPASGELRFQRQKNYSRKTIFIVDEASMISDQSDISSKGLLNDLIEYVFEHHTNKLLLVGDRAQLPPVGTTLSPALDPDYLENTFGLYLRHFSLKEVVRQEQNSGILSNATHLRKQLDDNSLKISLSSKVYTDVFRMNHEKMEDGLRYAYDKYGLDRTTIICRSNWQAVQYNEFIRRNILFYEDEIAAGDILMVVRNNYYYLDENSIAGFIANGDFVEVRKVKRFEEMHEFRYATLELQLVDYPEEPVFEARVFLDTLHSKTPALSMDESKKLYSEVVKDYMDIKTKKAFKEAVMNDKYLNALQVKYAYALTCHKSQGGQWEAVFVDHSYVPKTSEREIIRWLYTAITRAESELFLTNFSDDYFED